MLNILGAFWEQEKYTRKSGMELEPFWQIFWTFSFKGPPYICDIHKPKVKGSLNPQFFSLFLMCPPNLHK